MGALAVLTALGTGYGGLFLDDHLRELLEDFGTRQNGAAVNIDSLHLSWWNRRLELKGIQVARTSQPMRNLLALDRVTIEFLPSELLRNKLIVTDLKVEGVRTGTARESSGEIAWQPGTPPAGPGLLDRSSTAVYPVLNNRYPENPLGRLARFSMGLDVQNKFDAHRDRLQSLRELRSIAKDLETARGQWRETLAKLPGEEWVAEHKKHLAAPERVLASAVPSQSAERARDQREVRELRDHLREAVASYRKQADTLQNRLDGMHGAIDSDTESLRATLGLPSLDAADLTPLIFGPRLTGYFGRLGYLIDLARRRMPNGTRQGLIFGSASYGVDVHFAKMSTMPAMLIEKGSIVSDLEKEPGGGKVRGVFENITSDPPILRKPMKFALEADFPSEQIEKLHLVATMDHIGETVNDTFDFSIASLPIHHWPLHQGSDLGIFVERGTAHASFHGTFTSQIIDAHWKARMNGVSYAVTTPYLELADRLHTIFNTIPDISVDGALAGPSAGPKLELHSNFGKTLASSLPSVFKNPLGAIDDSIRKFILDEIDGPRKRLVEQTGAWREEFETRLQKELQQLDGMLKT